MKKSQFVLYGVVLVIVILIAQRSGLLKSFVNKQLSNQPPTPVVINTNEPILGMQLTMIDKQNAEKSNLVEGAYITQIIKGSPAEKAKLQEKDIITKIDSYLMDGLQKQDVYKLITNFKTGRQVNFKVSRDQKSINMLVTLE